MRYLSLCICFLLALTSASAQFKSTKKGLTIIVSDGTEEGRNSDVLTSKDIPTSYDYVGGKSGKKSAAAAKKKNEVEFTDPIRELGMTDCIQAAAFLERPKYGKTGFMLIFSINDAIGGKQATLVKGGKTYKGVYRIVRQKTSAKEPTPKGMATYQVKGTFLLLGMS